MTTRSIAPLAIPPSFITSSDRLGSGIASETARSGS
jgi:hypothetical protein